MTSSKSKTKNQIEKFQEVARSLKANEREEDFNAALKKVAKVPPSQKKSKAGPKKASK